MADPLSISSGIAGLITLSASIVSTCYAYGCAVSDGPSEVQKLIDEIMGLSGVLSAVKALIDRTSNPQFIGPTVITSAGLDDAYSTYPDLLPPPPPYTAHDSPRTDHFKHLLDPLDGSQRVLSEVSGALRAAEIRHEPRLAGRIFKRLVWPLKRERTLELVAGVERFKSLYVLALSGTNASLTVDVQRTVDEIRSAQVLERLERRVEQREVKLQSCYRWLCPVSWADAHRAARGAWLEGTGTWMMKDAAWRDWFDAERKFLWLYGIPGSGKTVMTSTLLEQCAAALTEEKGARLAYFYCDFRNKESQRPEYVLGGLVVQLCSQLEKTPAPLQEFIQAHRIQPDRFATPTCKDLEKLLLKVLEFVPRATIIVDALDECMDRHVLLEVLTALPATDQASVKVLVSSRQEGDIEAALSGFDRLSTRVDAHDQEIALYVSSCMSSSERLRRLPDPLRQTVTRALVQGACGMFRWVQCQIDVLSRLRTDRDIRQALTKLPHTLYGAYERILEQIEEIDRPVARRALLWLAYGPRAMTLSELAEAVVIDEDTVQKDPEAAWHPPDLLKVIGSLARYSAENEVIELAHHSVKEFLETAPLYPSLSAFHLSPSSGRAELARTMLTYLLMHDFSTSMCGSSKLYYARVAQYPLLPLAARYWPYYAKDSIASASTHTSDDSVFHLAHKLFRPQPTPNWWAWVEALIAQGPNDFKSLERGVRERYEHWAKTRLRYKAAPPHLRPLYYAASFGLGRLVASLLAQGADINEHGGLFGGTALHAAIYREHVDVVRVLLEAGPRLWERDRNDMTPWFMTVNMTGNKEIWRLMRSKGADKYK
ncbi:MAG: hypothetical protein Q9160_000175 [Pyrenula sp. 1 TL-2023]